MNRHSIALLAILVVIGIGLGAAVNYQRGKALPLGAAGTVQAGAPGAPASAPAGGGLVINGMAVGQPAAPAASAPATPSAQVPAPAADAGTCP